ncbi:MAG: 3-isopropylmalate dehydratase [Methanoregulaceae archaeon]|nr:3-isopropylmalate dehydratase [Methanoregulaceae archaeon]
MRVEGHAVCLPPDIDTDLIIAGRYLRTKDRSIWATHVFEDLDPSLAGRLRESVIIAGKNFGCGSSREQAAVALKEAGVVCIIAPSFARIFFRNAINRGLPLAQADLSCHEGEQVVIDFSAGIVTVGGLTKEIPPLSPRMLEILAAGGLVEHWRKRE